MLLREYGQQRLELLYCEMASSGNVGRLELGDHPSWISPKQTPIERDLDSPAQSAEFLSDGLSGRAFIDSLVGVALDFFKGAWVVYVEVADESEEMAASSGKHALGGSGHVGTPLVEQIL